MDGAKKRPDPGDPPEDWQDFRFCEGKYATTSTDDGQATLDPSEPPWEPPWQPVARPLWVQRIQEMQDAILRAELNVHLERMSAGDRIRLLRRVRGWTQQWAAHELGVSRRTIIRYERGQHRLPWMRLSMEHRLRELESISAELLVSAFVTR
jgi:DNA-binding XRE family transcriptional regulator